ncbi:adenylate cyclase, partial [Streptomyces lasiicapitis]
RGLVLLGAGDVVLRVRRGRGGVAETPDGLLSVDPADGRVRDRSGTPHPRRFALGPHTDARGAGAFTRPRTNSPSFRQNDATARAVLTFFAEAAP